MSKAVQKQLFFAVAIAWASLVSLNVPNALGAPGDIANLGTLGGASSRGLAINDAGQVTGFAYTTGGSGHAFRYSGAPGAGGVMVDLGTLGGSGSGGRAINDAGQVAGTSAFGATRAFLYSGAPGAGGAMVDLGTLGGDRSYGYAINNAGQVVGDSTTDSPGFRSRAFLYSGTPGAGGAMVSLGTLGGPDSFGFAINDAGQIAGEAAGPVNTSDGYYEYHAFLYTGTPGAGGAMVDLGTLGGIRSSGEGINEAGQVAGWSDTTGEAAEHAFRYTGTPGAGGAMTDLGTLGGRNSHGLAINDAGLVVGWADRSAAAGGGSWATLWLTDTGNTAVDLDAWLDATNPAFGAYWTLSTASGINNRGLITGWGDYNDGAGGLSDGTRAFILDASSIVPEPTIPGDYNLDGTVDAADYVVWRKSGGTQNDYNTWRANFGTVSPEIGAGSGAALPSAEPLPAAVPEPASCTLLLLISVGLFVLPRRRGDPNGANAPATKGISHSPCTSPRSLTSDL